MPSGGPPFRLVDLFCGCGGMTLGMEEGARRAGVPLQIRLAMDAAPHACRVYKGNFPMAPVVAGDVRLNFDGIPGETLSEAEEQTASFVGPLDALLGGPPCEGHSNLNNHTRRKDKKNALYLRMARAAEVLRPSMVVVENVPPVQWDSERVVEATREALEKLGYEVHGEVLDMSRVGVPQSRRRYILLASLIDSVNPRAVLKMAQDLETELRTVRWAIGDLKSTAASVEMDKPSRISEDNQRRIAYLFDNRVYDLPNSERPECHQDENHSYKSMYGRLRWDRPAQTITTGFTSMGQGRFVNPGQRRTLTPHEAARLQTFPDWFDWSSAPGRSALSRMIGNAVPPLMMTVLGTILIPLVIQERSQSTRPARPGVPSASSDEAGRRMRAVRQAGTQPEQDLKVELRARGMRFTQDVSPEPGMKRRADFLFRRSRVVVMVDGCFWHSCPEHSSQPKANAAWWREKLQTNRRRDKDTDERLADAGWTVIRIWAHENMGAAAERIYRLVGRKGGQRSNHPPIRSSSATIR